jgi:uncharacterized Zn-finger protein
MRKKLREKFLQMEEKHFKKLQKETSTLAETSTQSHKVIEISDDEDEKLPEKVSVEKKSDENGIENTIEKVPEKEKSKSNPKMFQCNLCEFLATRKSHLNRHLNVHRTNPNYKYRPQNVFDPSRQFPCPIEGCSKYFKTKRNLTSHQPVHEGNF